MGAIAITDMGSRRPTRVYAPNLVDNIAANWTKQDGNIVLSNPEPEKIRVTQNSTSTYGWRTFDVDAGATYLVSAVVATEVNVSLCKLVTRDGANTDPNLANSLEAFSGTVSVFATPTGSTMTVRLDSTHSANPASALFSEISVRQVTTDFKLGPNLVQNGDFDFDDSNWTPNETIPTDQFNLVGAAGLKIKNITAVFGYVYQVIPTVAGQTYSFSGDFTEFSASNKLNRVGTSAGSSSMYNGDGSGSVISFETTFVASGAEAYISLGNASSFPAAYQTVDNISVREHLTETISETTLGASDTLEYASGQSMVLILRNGSGGALTPKLDGADGALIAVDGVGNVDVSAGYIMTSIDDGAVAAIRLDGIKAFLPGVLTITGASGITATCIRF